MANLQFKAGSLTPREPLQELLRTISTFDAGMASEEPIPIARVQWWDVKTMQVLCPWCSERHYHGFTGKYEGQLRVAHCGVPRTKTSPTPTYHVQFAISPPLLGYEIDKERFRFITGNGLVDQEDLVPSDQIERLRRSFRERVDKRAKWTSATEKLTIFEDFSIEVITRVVSEMVRGNVKYVRNYLETSSEAHIFLHGVESWVGLPCDLSVSDDDEAHSTQPDDCTSGETALHMAAAEQYPEMIRLLVTKGADVNAADVNGRTPLMEAAFWGRLENVQILLLHGADKSLQCICDGSLQLATDFAKPTKRNARARRMRAGGLTGEPIYKEDSYTRDLDREHIVRLLDDEAPSHQPPQLEGFAFEHGSRQSHLFVSLTTQFSVPSEWKTVASLHRGQGFTDVAAMSGWGHGENEVIHIAGREWTTEVLELCALLEFELRPHTYDHGVVGQWEACHAEKQLIAYFVNRHVFLETEIREPGEKDLGITGLLEQFIMGELTEDMLAQRRLEEKQKEEVRERKLKLRKLWAVRPEISVREAVIMVSKPVCSECKRFIAHVNERWELALRVRHRCLDDQCRECST